MAKQHSEEWVELNSYQDDERLRKILECIFKTSKVNEEERFPVFIGKIIERETQDGSKVMNIDEIKTLWGTDLKNPYHNNQNLRAIIKKNTLDLKINTKVVFVATVGRKIPVDAIAGKSICTFEQLGVSDDCSDADLSRSLQGKEEYSEYAGYITELLEKKGEYKFQYDTVEELKRKCTELKQKKDELDDAIQAIAPQGIEAKRTELNQLQEKYDSLKNVESRIAEIERKAKYYLKMPLTNPPLPSDVLFPTDDSNPINEFSMRLEYKYDNSLVLSFLTALSTNQIIILFGAPGTGKTTFISKTAKALGAKCTMLSVQNNWTDGADLLGYYSPIEKTYESTPFIDAILNAYKDWLQYGLDSRLHIICLDEMNLARVEYYFASFLGLLQLEPHERWIRLLPKHIQAEINTYNSQDNLPNGKEYLRSLREYTDFLLPPNVRFVGTINDDETTNTLSPKVIDRSYFIELSKDQHALEQNVETLNGYYPLRFFEIDNPREDKAFDDFASENNRFMKYARVMFAMWGDKLKMGSSVTEFCEQLIMAKVLPSLRRASDYSYDPERYPKAYNAFAKHRYHSSDAYNYLGGKP